MSILQTIECPADLRRLDPGELRALAKEIRRFLVAAVCGTGGHLGPNLGVVELTLALHRTFDSPADRIIWDTGHQAYVHKLVTGRREAFGALRRADGLSGYPRREESAHDLVENSHASTALSYADGLAKAFELCGERDRRVVAVVGDGALTGGLSWEALNNLGAAAGRPVIVVLNDNGRSYAPTVGGVAHHLARLREHGRPADGCLFENLGFAYLGPVDGHDVAATEAALRRARALRRPVVVHCVTRKGHGYPPAEDDLVDHLHTVGVVDAATGRPATPRPQSWTGVFADELVRLAAADPRLVAITAAMPTPTGLSRLAEASPGRVFDVGIAEQHAVTSAAGLAMGGMHPVVAVYATFLNRAFDQALMDVALHRLPVTFVLDRAGVTGEDGPSHHGMWDLSVFQLPPGFRIAAPRDAATLRAELREAVGTVDGPTLVRFPKSAVGPDLPALGQVAGVDVLRLAPAGNVLLVSVGAMAGSCLRAAELLAAEGVDVTVADPRWVCPPHPGLAELAAGYRHVVTVEDNVTLGGVGAALGQHLGGLGIAVPVHNLGIPQAFLPQGSRSQVLAGAGLGAERVAEAILQVTRAGAGRPVPAAAAAGRSRSRPAAFDRAVHG